MSPERTAVLRCHQGLMTVTGAQAAYGRDCKQGDVTSDLQDGCAQSETTATETNG